MIVVPSPKVAGATVDAAYDAWNRLVSLDDGLPSQATYQYDGLNRRISRTEPSTGTTEFYYNEGSQVLTETNGSGTPKAIYSYWQGYIDAVAVRMRPNDEHLFVHDNQYSVTSAVNRATREVDERYRYSPYGETTVLDPEFNPKTDNTSTLDNEYTYTGRRLDPSGLMYFRARYYDPNTGQFISRDPLGYVDGMSQYRAYFVPGAVDPMGLCSTDEDYEYSETRGSGCPRFNYKDVYRSGAKSTTVDISGASAVVTTQGAFHRSVYLKKRGKRTFLANKDETTWTAKMSLSCECVDGGKARINFSHDELENEISVPPSTGTGFSPPIPGKAGVWVGMKGSYAVYVGFQGGVQEGEGEHSLDFDGQFKASWVEKSGFSGTVSFMGVTSTLPFTADGWWLRPQLLAEQTGDKFKLTCTVGDDGTPVMSKSSSSTHTHHFIPK